MTNFYSRRLALFPGTSADSSNYTSASWLAADFRQLTVSWTTDAATASRLTLWGSNDDGLRSALAEADWSTLTGIVAAGVYTVDPGVRWVRATRNSNESLAEVYIQART